MTILRGPADADNFRVKVGRYGDRWYTDPLPGDTIADATPDNEVFPSVSTCKKASGSDWSYVALKRVAVAMETPTYARLDQQPYDHRYEALKTINKLGLEAAGKRGTNVHLMAEARLYGRLPTVGPDDPGGDYKAAVDQFFDHYQPTLDAAEFVCIHRTLNGTGYGGTADAILDIDGKKYLVDWKSRGIDSDHGAYPEEAAQIAAYARADYIIVEGEHGSERRLMPALDGGLIVSIKPDGCRVYPIDLDAAFVHWTALHAWWVARQNERAAVGRQWPQRKGVSVKEAVPVPKPVEQAAEPTTDAAGEVAMSPASPALLDEELADVDWDAITERQLGQRPTLSPDPARLAVVQARDQLTATPDQGRDLSEGFDELWAAMKAQFDALDPAARSWRGELVSEAQRRHVPFHVQQVRTERTYQINKGIIALCVADGGTDELLRALLALVIGDVALFPSIHPGHALGSLGAAEATRFADLVDTFNGPGLAAWIDKDQIFRLRELSPA